MSRLPTLASIPESGRAPMTDEQSSLFVGIAFATAKNDSVYAINELEQKLGELFGTEFLAMFQARVYLERLKIAGDDLKYSPHTFAWTLTLCRNVAEVVMWAYTLVAETRAGRPVTIERLTELFPKGFPTEEAVHDYWDAQKVHPSTPSIFGWDSDNRLDEPLTWKPDGTPIKTEGVF